MTSLIDELRSFVVDNFLFGQPHELSDDSSFLESGIIDSTGMLELIAFLERTYAIRLEDAELIPDNLDSLRKLAGLVSRKLAGREAVPEPSHGERPAADHAMGALV